MLLLAFLLLLAVAGVLGWQIGRGLVRPIRELAGARQESRIRQVRMKSA